MIVLTPPVATSKRRYLPGKYTELKRKRRSMITCSSDDECDF